MTDVRLSFSSVILLSVFSCSVITTFLDIYSLVSLFLLHLVRYTKTTGPSPVEVLLLATTDTPDDSTKSTFPFTRARPLLFLRPRGPGVSRGATARTRRRAQETLRLGAWILVSQ